MSSPQLTPSSPHDESTTLQVATRRSPGGRPGTLHSGPRLCAPIPGGNRPPVRRHAIALCPDGITVKELIARIGGAA